MTAVPPPRSERQRQQRSKLVELLMVGFCDRKLKILNFEKKETGEIPHAIDCAALDCTQETDNDDDRFRPIPEYCTSRFSLWP